MREITEEWISKAEDDYRSAEALLHLVEPPIVETACFHCQQCAEKYVKAYLEEHDVEFPRNHNLMQLLDFCIQLDESFETIRRPLQSLEHYAVTIRYPGLRVPLDLGKRHIKPPPVFVNLCGRNSKWGNFRCRKGTCANVRANRNFHWRYQRTQVRIDIWHLTLPLPPPYYGMLRDLRKGEG